MESGEIYIQFMPSMVSSTIHYFNKQTFDFVFFISVAF